MIGKCLAIFVVSLWAVPTVWGASCPSFMEAEDHFKDSSFVFKGMVDSIEYCCDGMRKVKFKVNHVLKGESRETEEILTDKVIGHDAFGYPFMCGGNYIVYASMKYDYLYASRCSPTHSIDDNALESDEIDEILYSSPADPRRQDIATRLNDCRDSGNVKNNESGRPSFLDWLFRFL